MKVSAINSTNYYSNNCKPRCIKSNSIQHKPAFKGYMGESAGSALGMLCGVAATFFTGPIAAVVIAGIGCVGGGIAGGKIEDKLNDNDKKD